MQSLSQTSSISSSTRQERQEQQERQQRLRVQVQVQSAHGRKDQVQNHGLDKQFDVQGDLVAGENEASAVTRGSVPDDIQVSDADQWIRSSADDNTQ